MADTPAPTTPARDLLYTLATNAARNNREVTVPPTLIFDALREARATPAEALDVLSDDFRDALSSAMQDHIGDPHSGWPHPRGNLLKPDAPAIMQDGCDDLCADDIAEHLDTRLHSQVRATPPEPLDASDPVAQAKFALHRFARTTEDAKIINRMIDDLAARLELDLE